MTKEQLIILIKNTAYTYFKKYDPNISHDKIKVFFHGYKNGEYEFIARNLNDNKECCVLYYSPTKSVGRRTLESNKIEWFQVVEPNNMKR